MNTLIIEPATLDDLAGIVAIEQQVFTWAWDEADYEALLNTDACHLFVARYAEQEPTARILGYVALQDVQDHREVYVLTLAVDPFYTRQGIGKQLLALPLHYAEAMDGVIALHVRCSNTAAIHLYESCGLRCAGTINDFFPDGEAAQYMLRFNTE